MADSSKFFHLLAISRAEESHEWVCSRCRGFNLANKLIQLDSNNSEAKQSQYLALAALGVLCHSSVCVCPLLLEALSLECYNHQKGD